MPYDPTDRPSARTADAVAARSILAVSCSLRLHAGDAAADLIDAHAVLPDGTVVLAVDAMTPLGGRLVAARGRRSGVRLDVTQLVAVPVRSRVRARVTVHGTVRPFDPGTLDTCDTDTVLALLDLPATALWSVEPVAVRIEREQNIADVPVFAYRAAVPDPIAAVETAHLQHLVRQHGHRGERLAALVDVTALPASARLVPIGIDADGLTVRAEATHEYRDVHLPFSRRVTTEAGLTQELRVLLARATAGLPAARARP
jgi:hypothetical protein